MFKETRKQVVQGVQDNSLLAPKYKEIVRNSRVSSNVLNSLNSLNSLSTMSKRSLRKLSHGLLTILFSTIAYEEYLFSDNFYQVEIHIPCLQGLI